MKKLRSLLLPAAAFMLAWIITHFVSGWNGSSHSLSPGRIGPAPVSGGRSSGNAVTDIASAFAASPVLQWNGLWEAFARNATASELEAVSGLPSGDQSNQRGLTVLRSLADEELSVRTRKAKLLPGALAALAESDPDTAWDQLRKNNYEALWCVVLRTLAWRDPEDALRRFKELPPGIEGEFDTSMRSAYIPSVEGSLFGAWARRDPLAALSAMKASGTHGAPELYRTWAFRDGPAAVRYIATSTSGTNSAGPMDVILRASFRLAPAETAKLMNEYASLRKSIFEESCYLRVLKPWFEADPDRVRAWLRERGGGEMWLTRYAVRSNPVAGAELIREFPKAAFPDQVQNITRIAQTDSALGAALADELGLRAQVEDALTAIQIRENPADACDEWLAALKQHGPDGALPALGWSVAAAKELARFAVEVFPDKAKELAALLPAKVLAAGDKRFRSEELSQFWPELAPPPPPVPTLTRTPLETQLSLDPGGTAEALLAKTPGESEVWQVVRSWAPHNTAAARAWLDRVPEGNARQAGELALAMEQAPRDPAGVLQRLASSPGDQLQRHSKEAGRLWSLCLQRLLITGGDWRAWLDRIPSQIKVPASQVSIGSNLKSGLETEAQLLALLRKSGGR